MICEADTFDQKFTEFISERADYACCMGRYLNDPDYRKSLAEIEELEAKIIAQLGDDAAEEYSNAVAAKFWFQIKNAYKVGFLDAMELALNRN